MPRRQDLPVRRLLRLSLFQLTVGMAVVLVVGTLNRVMIVELGVPAWLVAVMISIPLIVAPYRAVVGYKSDTHRSVMGWRRLPYLWKGTAMQFGGLAIMPFALLAMSGDGREPTLIGEIGAALAFLLVGAGLHTVQTIGLALATDLAPKHKHPQVVTLLCGMMLLGMVISAVAVRHRSARLSITGQPDTGGANRLGDHVGGQLFRAVEAGAVRSQLLCQQARQEPAEAADFPRRLGDVHSGMPDRSGRWSSSASAHSGSRLRISCWSRSAGRSCIFRSARRHC